MKKNNLKKLSLKKEIVAQLDKAGLHQIAGGYQQSNPCSDFRRCDIVTEHCAQTVVCIETVPCID